MPHLAAGHDVPVEVEDILKGRAGVRRQAKALGAGIGRDPRRCQDQLAGQLGVREVRHGPNVLARNDEHVQRGPPPLAPAPGRAGRASTKYTAQAVPHPEPRVRRRDRKRCQPRSTKPHPPFAVRRVVGIAVVDQDHELLFPVWSRVHAVVALDVLE